MKFSCEKQLFQDTLTNCARAVPSHATIDVLKGVLIEATADGLSMTGNDMELAISARLDADVAAPGRCVLECKMLLDIVRKMPDETLFVEVDDRFVASIVCGQSDFSLSALPVDNYPGIPEVSGLRTVSLLQSRLRGQLSQTLFSVADSENKLVHTGALFDFEPGALTVVALDGHRLALCRKEAEVSEVFTFVVPGASLREIEKMLSDDEEEAVTVHIGQRHALFELGQTTVVTRLLEGEFLKYKNAIPQNRTFHATFSAAEMTACLDRVSLLISDRLKNPVKLQFTPGEVIVSTVTAVGRAVDTIVCEADGELEVGFNNRYLLEAVRHISADTARFETGGPVSPCLILPPEDENTLLMVLPVRLKNET